MFMRQAGGRFMGGLSDSGSDVNKATPINLLASAVNTLKANAAARNPKAIIRSRLLEHREYTETLELAVNQAIKELRLREELRRIITDSVFGAGFIKTGLATSGSIVTVDGLDIEIGQPFAERIDPDDIIIDPLARNWDEQNAYGHRVRLKREDLLEMGVPQRRVDELVNRHQHMAQMDAASITNRQARAEIADLATNVFEYVDVAEIFLPQEKRIVMLPYKLGALFDDFLLDFEWSGPETGPIHMLGYEFLPDSLLPVHKAGMIFDLHLLMNKVARKIGRQSDRNKRILAYEDQAAEDAEAIANTDDGGSVRVQNIDALKELEMGGVTDQAYQFAAWVKNEFSEQAGNIDQLSGTAAAAPTATQSEILQANSSVRLSDMQDQIADFTTKVVSDIVFYLHTDPLIKLPFIKRENGRDRQIIFSPAEQEADFLDFNVSIETASMARRNPQKRLRDLMEVATSVIPATASAAQLFGPGFKSAAFLARILKEMDIEDADEFFDGEEFNNAAVARMNLELDKGKAEIFAKSAKPAPGGVRPQQPNPNQTGPTGGVPVGTQRASDRQAPAATSAGQMSTRDLAEGS